VQPPILKASTAWGDCSRRSKARERRREGRRRKGSGEVMAERRLLVVAVPGPGIVSGSGKIVKLWLPV